MLPRAECIWSTTCGGYDACPHPLHTFDSYKHQLRTHLVKVELLDDSARDRLASLLVMRVANPWGRTVKTKKHDLAAEFNLKSHDKLVVLCGQVFYERDLDAISTPAVVYFWRPRVDSFLATISVLWDIPEIHQLGIKHFTPAYFPDDTLHTSALGYEAKVAGLTLWKLIGHRVFGTIEGHTKAEVDTYNFMEMKKLLKPYYKNERMADPSKILNHIRNFTIGMLGSEDRPEVSARGGEIRSLLKFAYNMSRTYSVVDPVFPVLATALSACLDINSMLRILPRQVPTDKQKQIVGLYFRFV